MVFRKHTNPNWLCDRYLHHKNTVRINIYLAKYFKYRNSSYSSSRILVNRLSNLNLNTQNLSVLVRYANFYVKNLRKNNDKITQFHWSRKSRDSCPTSFVPCPTTGQFYPLKTKTCKCLGPPRRCARKGLGNDILTSAIPL